MTPKSIRTLQLVALASSWAFAAEPIVIADFEGENFGTWKVVGDAFGKMPAQGSSGNQKKISGFAGKGLANSYHSSKGDGAEGALAAPAIKIERKFITFLIGGGSLEQEASVNLLVDGKLVRTATGPAGGSQNLKPAAWDVSEFSGKEATIEIVDKNKGSFGHVLVDQIVQTDDRGDAALAALPLTPPQKVTRKLKISADYLQLPVMGRTNSNRKDLNTFTLEIGGKVMRIIHVDLALKGETPEQVYSYDVSEFKGQEAVINYSSREADALDKLELNDQQNRDPKAYEGEHRPRFHFSPRVGWMNDINGSYYKDGLYHLFYQYNPTNRASGAGYDMHWGHSVSKDLVHWEEWPVALSPDHTGQCYSGTAITAQADIPGLAKKGEPVLFFSGTTPYAQHIATTPDGGRSWKRYAGNPVIKNIGSGDRDPKVVWHEASQHYCMVLYIGGPDTYRFFRSKDLINWEETSKIAQWFECPEFFQVKSALTGEELWLLYGCYRTPKDAAVPFNSNSCYQLGKFDGKTFTPVTEHRHAHEGPNFYASLIFMNQPDDRKIIMGWTRGTGLPPGELFNQYASVPLEMTIKAINKQDTLCFEPAKELDALRGKAVVSLKNASLADAQAKLDTLSKDEQYDVVMKLKPTTGIMKVKVRGSEMNYDPEDGGLVLGSKSTKIHPTGSLDVRLLIDRGVAESFWNQGEASFCFGSNHQSKAPVLALDGAAEVEELTVYPLANIWKK